MSAHMLASTLLMGILFGAVFLGVSRLSDHRHVSTAETDALVPADGAAESRLASTFGTPGRLGAVFIAITIGAGVLTVAAVGGLGVSPDLNVFGVVMGLLGLLLTGFVFAGTYVMTRQHGFGNAQAIATGLFCVGIVGVLVIAANLALQFA